MTSSRSRRSNHSADQWPVVRQRSKLHEPDAISKSWKEVGGDFKGQSRLADATRAGEDDQGLGGNEPRQLSTRVLAPNEATQWARQVR